MVTRRFTLGNKSSVLLLGPRQTGKSTLIREFLTKKNHFEINLLETDAFARYIKDPSLLRKDVEFQINKKKISYVFIDEIQKIPILTNEVHNLIEKTKIRFILSGSSARKLKRGNANLLGGRCIVEYLFPFTLSELQKDFDLEEALHFGTLVGIYFDDQATKKLKLRSYVETYLKEEIAQEGLVRNFDYFHRFLDVSGVYATDIINYANIARECSLSLKTVQNYFSILYETLIAFELPAWGHKVQRQLSQHSKFYFCDNGILNAINRRLNDPLDPDLRGKLVEQWIINEIRALLSYNHSEMTLHYWRTHRGEHEVDLILAKGKNPVFAIEIKAKKRINKGDIKGLLELKKEYPSIKLFCVCETSMPYELDGVDIMPWREFLTMAILNPQGPAEAK